MGSAESTLPLMEDSSASASHNQSENQENHNLRTRREPDTAVGGSDISSADDPWWWEIENENLLLDRVPNITTESSTEPATGATLSEDFNTLLKIGQNANLTLVGDTSPTNNNTTDISVSAEDMESSSGVNNKTKTDPTPTDYPKTECTTASITTNVNQVMSSKDIDDQESAAATRAQTLDEFKEELRLKRIARQTAVQDLREEIATLRKQLTAEQALNHRLRHRDDEADGTLEKPLQTTTERKQSFDVAAVDKLVNLAPVDEDDENVCSRSRHANIELANAQLSLQLATSENLSLRTELTVTQKQVGTLKEVVACCKQMMAMKEEQCAQLKTKLSEIEESFGEREMKIMSDNLRQEYERQLGNIRQLRQLYEERQRIAAAEHENLQRLISIKRDELAAEQERTKNFEERNQILLKEVETTNNELAELREECNEHKFEKKALKEEMGVVNTLFSQMLMGFNGKNNLDIDRLATMLEENRTLLNDMATKEANCSDGATLPKLLFELVEQAAVGTKAIGSSRSHSPSPDTDTHVEADDEKANEAALVDEADVVDEVATSKSSANKDAAGKDDKCDAHEAEDVDDNDDASQVRQVVEGGIDNAPSIVVASEDDNVNNQSCNNNGGSSNNGKKHHHRKTTTNNKMKTSSCLATNSNSNGSSDLSTTYKFHEPEVMGQVASTQEIIGNLPKVWKVLMELLSHHKIEQVQFEENGASEDCYKSVETPNGPKAELSVSKTYIKLKDLILEKKSLVKETNRLKTLNCHLDYRLNEQEKRLSAVSLELTKTWHLVGKMQRQHRQLHTQEQILRYQLQQKRRLLSELKDELEYCRRKWAAARAKNDESQEQCNDLRREFAKRKLEDANHSAESGYSDSSGPASDEEVRTVRAAVLVPVEASEMAEGGRNNLRAMFEHSRKIKRMQSTSPGRAAAAYGKQEVAKIVELRWNSAPPTCGWGGDDEENEEDNSEPLGDGMTKPKGAIPKTASRNSRSKQRIRDTERLQNSEEDASPELDELQVSSGSENSAQSADRAVRIQRLEKQCKSLIQQVLETSDNREQLEIQLCRFQDEIAPVQYAIPLNEFITKKRIERMTRASSAPASPAGALTQREEEYTRKRSERLGRLEEESRQLISRIKRTSDRGNYLRCTLDRLHRTRLAGGSVPMSREGSFESNTEEEVVAVGEAEIQEQKTNSNSTEDKASSPNSPLTTFEEAYTKRRSERLKRLEDESKQLLAKLSQNTQRGSQLSGKLDVLHVQHGNNGDEMTSTSTPVTAPTPASPTIEKRIENIERISSNRAERLRILEEEGNQLISRLSSTSERGTRIINRIAERELNRAARLAENANKESASREATPTPQTSIEESAPESGAPLMPLLKSVACTSIVSEELAECVTVTTTTSRIAATSQQPEQGAVPKSKPLAQLSVASKMKTKSASTPRSPAQLKSNSSESLEEMVKRLQSLPFPDAEKTTHTTEVAETESEPQSQDGDQADVSDKTR